MSDAATTSRTEKQPARRRHDPEGTRRNILTVARREFARNGLSGARVDKIAEKTATSKRMIYYYFGDKEGLYAAALEATYADLRMIEGLLDIARLSPPEALRQLALTTFDYHTANPDHIRMVMIENIHNGRFIARSKTIASLNRSAVDKVAQIYADGVASGDFRDGLKPIDIHWLISSLSFFAVSNQHTFNRIFAADLGDDRLADLRRQTLEAVVRYVLKPERLLALEPEFFRPDFEPKI